jgi:His Kinase A (phospho-acceptor) domain
MPPSDTAFTPMGAQWSHGVSPTTSRQLLAIGLDRGRLDGVAALTSPHVNLFVTSSPQKALVWTRLESMDLILLRFGPPVEQALDLVQALIEANPTPLILLLVEPEAEAVAEHLTRQQICAAQPASIATEPLTQQILRLLGHSTEHPMAPRPSASPRPAPSTQSVPPVHPFPPPIQLHPDDAHWSPPAPAMEAPPITAPTRISSSAPTGISTGVSGDWELPFLDQLVIELAHRLKNPLVSIKTFTHLLQERFNDADFRARFYAIVNNDIIQLNDVVDRLLEFTEFSRPYPKQLNLADELKQVAESLEPFLKSRQVTVQLMAPEGDHNGLTVPPRQTGPLQLYADPIQFHYLLKQLLLDSAMAAPSGGCLRIRLLGPQAGRDETEPTCTILIDTIIAATTPRLHDWLSLELLLAKNLMERHRGTVTVSVTGHGDDDNRQRCVTATFSLGAPSRRDTHPAAPVSQQASESIERRRFPLTIAFRERRVSQRRQEQHPITFADRRRTHEEGEDTRAFHPQEERRRPGSPPPYTPG